VKTEVDVERTSPLGIFIRQFASKLQVLPKCLIGEMVQPFFCRSAGAR
jgi:hypothetical protein